jgi:type II secretory pathway component HofQ
VRAIAITLLMACAEPSPPPPRAANVDVPSWAEGTPPTRPPMTVASTVPTSLGTDEPKKPAHGKKISIDVVSADLANVCRLIGELAGVNIVVAEGVTGSVTVKMHGVPWNEALDAILLSKGYHAEQLGSVIVVRAK